MPETPNHGYNVPDEGAQNWHEPLNENFEQYDTDIEIRDEEANRSNYDPKAGAKFLATDTENVYIGDGSNWQSLATSGLSPSFDELNPSNNFLGIARSDRITDAEYFGVDATVKSGDFGGMYLNTASGSARPFYGYATDGVSRLWHHYDGASDEWRLEDNAGTRLVVRGDGSVGIGASSFPDRNKLHVDSNNEGSYAGSFKWSGNSLGAAVAAENTGDAGDAIQAIAGGSCRSAIRASAEDNADYALLTDGDIRVNGTLQADSKNFVQSVDTDDGEREVVYTTVEAGTPHTEASGVAELADGRATVGLPEHFAWVTDADEPLHVQTTPYAVESNGLAVVERSTERLVFADLDGTGDYEFSYTVKGTRDGHADKRVVREPSATAPGAEGPAPADD
ncbi:hypothetical protein [Haloglomus halophilum]|uniref:hypothetical protein n=1 Tax=Haloglomus halophilum TaxID=2962672 RepID=UPI0020C9CF79|nr:hypothetical protein [Haloglomus halophilum]